MFVPGSCTRIHGAARPAPQGGTAGAHVVLRHHAPGEFLVALAFNKQSDLSAHYGMCLWTGSDIIKDTMGLSPCGVPRDTA